MMKPWPYWLAWLVLALSSPAVAEESMVPPPELVGTWTSTTAVFLPSQAPARPNSEDRQMVLLTIQADGSVCGRVGGAVVKNASVARNRGWMGRNLNVKTDYILRGTLEGKVTPNDPGTNSKFTIPFNLENSTLQGTVMLLPKYPLTERLNLQKVKPSRSGTSGA